ncbi:TspO/MBR family protein [Jannaschia seosinensis]|uniref:TspO/MBR family protein n=1 Tax=Jannaschia seosinensis TaxID=313367 RepID=A0A0M7BCE6_9RHOB|nr:TspO/MBR family protein [Jannaschia seosinensis]CUH38946.1 TspO/MBR family protein [Jannaschia seosinensis]
MDWTLFPLYLLACIAAGATGVLFKPGDWYVTLDKPRWTPPDLLFPIAWTLIYLLLAFAAARVAPLPGSELALTLWSVQIALNTLWTPVFFGLHRMGLALVVILVLTGIAIWLFFAMAALDGWAAAAVLPYVIWLFYAASLNAAILRRAQPR